MENDAVQKLIDEIKAIQQLPYLNSISALSRKIMVQKLHAEIDKLGYSGERPPVEWNQLHNNQDGKSDSIN
jgi:hypothetical protein